MMELHDRPHNEIKDHFVSFQTSYTEFDDKPCGGVSRLHGRPYVELNDGACSGAP